MRAPLIDLVAPVRVKDTGAIGMTTGRAYHWTQGKVIYDVVLGDDRKPVPFDELQIEQIGPQLPGVIKGE